jgi:hypothetical protein
VYIGSSCLELAIVRIISGEARQDQRGVGLSDAFCYVVLDRNNENYACEGSPGEHPAPPRDSAIAACIHRPQLTMGLPENEVK